ncbi:hypothetical protein EW145_g4755 [Phellinidium pouzarii]|uniref:Major facilitator superfamily (MFS) profile domain-containing protein n=1 Tax=Phellinidium pouzarii TaxID=167371 RepID=A0A4S4L2C3_9AGAM|nr:hypothetical protein EW145_g4755 [Phellinidium pouzarii]
MSGTGAPTVLAAPLNQSITTLNDHTTVMPIHSSKQEASNTADGAKPDIEHVLVQDDPRKWSAGRKIVYLTSELIFIAGCIIVGTAKNIDVVIAMRCLQAFGSSAVFSVGAGTLADIYDPHERGKMMGIYYAAPLLGPSLGPILGGALTQTWNWRATFYFLAAMCALSFASFFLFKDTFRKERSLAYQGALRRMKIHREHSLKKKDPVVESQTTSTTLSVHGDVKTEEDSAATTEKDLEAQNDIIIETPTKQSVPEPPSVQDIKLSLRDVNPLAPLPNVLKRRSNLLVLLASGLLFAFSYSIIYTCSRTFSDFYGYNSLQVGLVLLAFGVGSMCGSICGGRWSDRSLQLLRAKYGKSNPEMRLKSTKWAMAALPLSSLAYAWLCQKKVHVAAVCTALFFAGFLSIWIYSSTLAYIVDANTGLSATAVACNSCFRGVLGFAAAELAVPLQTSIGDGGLYTIWAGLLGVSGILITFVLWRGKEWREIDAAKEEAARQASE